ncbi:MAG: type II secretion system protein, partial [Lactococcus chungangensis]|nr:type II secretion system protein [Lactococcus chungangensis]
MKKNKKGFTLIELLVVIAIIGLLATLSVIALNTARVKARDARRVSDVKQIQTALEMYFDTNDKYPDSTSTLQTSGFMSSVPNNPQPADGCTATNYVYNSASPNS